MQKLGKEGPTASADAPRAWEDMDCPDPSPRAWPLRSLLDLIHLGGGGASSDQSLEEETPQPGIHSPLYIMVPHYLLSPTAHSPPPPPQNLFLLLVPSLCFPIHPLLIFFLPPGRPSCPWLPLKKSID